MVAIKVNGQVVEAPEGANLLLFLNDTLGLDVPHYCYHPGLEPVGSCRMCQVELVTRGRGPDGRETERRNLAVSCRETVRAGLEVETHTATAREARRAAMEFLLLNHPLDCPICDKAGECRLQDYAFQTGQLAGRSVEPRRRLEKLADMGDVIVHDRERCILCTRCVRFFEKIEGKPQIGVFGRGDLSWVGTFRGRPLTGNYQGCLADICPVGSLTLKKFRFKQRVWDLVPVPSTCPLCSRGCSIYIDVARGGQVRRIRPRLDPEVNGYWICDLGRFGFDELNLGTKRLLWARLRDGGDAREAPLGEALAAAARLLAAAAGEVVAVASPFLTVEDGRAFAELTAKMRMKGFYLPPDSGRADGFLLTGEACPNRRGLAGLGLEPLAAAALLEAIPQARLVWLAGERLETMLPPAVLDACRRAPLLFQGIRLAGLESALVALPTLGWAEKSGTFVNQAGLARKIVPALPPPGDAAGDREIFLELKRLLLAPPGAERREEAR